MSISIKVIHLTSVHSRYDARIFLKQCSTLSSRYSCYLVVSDAKGNEQKNNINIIDVGSSRGRLDRIRNVSHRIFLQAVKLNGDIYHIHDPELIPLALKLKKLGKKVIFDAHEDFPKQILTKHYLPLPLRKIISFFAEKGERLLCRKFNGIVGATPFITDKFSTVNSNVVNINNYPKVDELETIENPTRVENQICYIGGISTERGIREIVQALTLTDNNITLALAGKFHSAELEKDITADLGWQKTNFLGFVSHTEIKQLLSTTQIGLVTLYPTISYLDSLPVKLFEYMCAGIPVIASDFPLWREIVLKHNCGLCVDPKNPTEIAEAIDYLINHPEIAKQMGENGFKAVQTEFNWSIEEMKLLKFYENMIGK